MLKYLELGNGPKTARMIIKPAFMQVRWNAGQFDNTIIYEDFEDAFYDLARRGHCVYPYAARSSDLRHGTGHRFNEIITAMAKSSKFVHIAKPHVEIYRKVPDITFGLPYKASVASFNSKHTMDFERHYFQ